MKKRADSPRYIALALSVVLFSTNVVFANKSTQDRSLGPFGIIRKVSKPSLQPIKGLIFHMEDIHMNHEAQQNISNVIQELIGHNQIDLIALEGAFESINVKRFQMFPQHEIIRKVANYLLRENKITGPIHALLLSKESYLPRVIGIDDAYHYQANIDAFRRSSHHAKADIEKLFSSMDQREHDRIELIKKLLNFSLTREEWENYCKGGLSSPSSPLRTFEHFYEEATVRDEKMVENLLGFLKRETRFGRGKSTPTIVVVTGGFHSRCIDARLRDEGYAVVSFIPKISKASAQVATRYLNTFSKNKTSIDRVFEGRKSFLSIKPDAGLDHELPLLAAVMSHDPQTTIELLDPHSKRIVIKQSASPSTENSAIMTNRETGEQTKISIQEFLPGDIHVTYQSLGVSFVALALGHFLWPEFTFCSLLQGGLPWTELILSLALLGMALPQNPFGPQENKSLMKVQLGELQWDVSLDAYNLITQMNQDLNDQTWNLRKKQMIGFNNVYKKFPLLFSRKLIEGDMGSLNSKQLSIDLMNYFIQLSLSPPGRPKPADDFELWKYLGTFFIMELDRARLSQDQTGRPFLEDMIALIVWNIESLLEGKPDAKTLFFQHIKSFVSFKNIQADDLIAPAQWLGYLSRGEQLIEQHETNRTNPPARRSIPLREQIRALASSANLYLEKLDWARFIHPLLVGDEKRNHAWFRPAQYLVDEVASALILIDYDENSFPTNKIMNFEVNLLKDLQTAGRKHWIFVDYDQLTVPIYRALQQQGLNKNYQLMINDIQAYVNLTQLDDGDLKAFLGIQNLDLPYEAEQGLAFWEKIRSSRMAKSHVSILSGFDKASQTHRDDLERVLSPAQEQSHEQFLAQTVVLGNLTRGGLLVDRRLIALSPYIVRHLSATEHENPLTSEQYLVRFVTQMMREPGLMGNDEKSVGILLNKELNPLFDKLDYPHKPDFLLISDPVDDGGDSEISHPLQSGDDHGRFWGPSGSKIQETNYSMAMSMSPLALWLIANLIFPSLWNQKIEDKKIKPAEARPNLRIIRAGA